MQDVCLPAGSDKGLFVFDTRRMSVWDYGFLFWRLGFCETDFAGHPIRFLQLCVPPGGFGLRSFCFRYPEDVRLGLWVFVLVFRFL